MAKFALPASLAVALSGLLALAGCDSTPDATATDDEAMAESTATTMDSGIVAAPAATETVIATSGATTAATPSDGTTTVTTGPDGTSVTVDDVHAPVEADGATATVTPNR